MSKTTIKRGMQRVLLMESGGVCANPACNQPLHEEVSDGPINIEELAHVIGESPSGPRGHHRMPRSKRNHAKNIILLCPRCHALIDKSPKSFPVKLLLRWKNNHAEAIRRTFHGRRFDSRENLCVFLEPIFQENLAQWESFGPFSPGAENPLADHYKTWKKVVIERIIPNNRLIDIALTENARFLARKEIKLLGAFKAHREAFEYNHLSGDKTTNAPLFPRELARRLFNHA